MPRAGAGRLALSAAPRGGPALEAEVAAFAAAGVTDVVCLLPDDELVRLGLADEPEVLRRNGLRVHRLPVPDFGVPDEEATASLVEVVTDRLADGASVVVHCRGGVGRSSTVVAVLLMKDGLRPDEAWRVLATARGRRVPETTAQRRFAARAAGHPEPPVPLAVRAGEAVGLRIAAAVARRRRGRGS